jgi:hypothetical protein
MSTDTSVTFSLAELAKIEEQRVHEEEARRASERERAAAHARRAEVARLAAEASKIAAEEDARARRQRAEAEEQARSVARDRAAIEVARIQAEAKARLDADNALRTHELDVLRVRTEGGRRRITAVLAGALALTVLGAAAWGVQSSSKVAALSEDAGHLRDAQQALAKEREQAKASELDALERRLALLGARPFAREAEDARAAAEGARKAIDVKALDQDRLRAFADALDALQARLEIVERLASLDKRRDDLAVWSAERKRPEALTVVRSAAARARAMGDDAAIRAYEAALDQARDALAKETGTAATRTTQGKAESTPARTCLAGDPGCGLDGPPLF